MSWFNKNTVDGLIKDITAKIEALHVVAELKAKEAQVHNAIAEERKKLEAEALLEFERAKKIAGNLTGLLS